MPLRWVSRAASAQCWTCWRAWVSDALAGGAGSLWRGGLLIALREAEPAKATTVTIQGAGAGLTTLVGERS